MMPTPTRHVISPDWATLIDDNQLTCLAEQGFLWVDDCFADLALQALQQESGLVDYQAATLTHGQRLSHIRGDDIRWIDENSPAGQQYLAAIEALAGYFNQTLFAGIRYCEAHYACYGTGMGYNWHVDNPQGRDERVLSAVFYLNEQWTAADGGAIELIDHQGHTQQLLPAANRLVVFDSNLRHRVMTTHRPRFSIATWLRRD